MAEQTKNIGAISANALVGFDLKDPSFGSACGFDVRELSVRNGSSATTTFYIHGQPYPIAPGSSAELFAASRIESLSIGADAAVNSGQLIVVLKGQPLASYLALLRGA